MIPKNEQGTIVEFVRQIQDTNWQIVYIQTAFPDVVIKDSLTGVTHAAEFEFKASNFKLHGHDLLSCDIIICWENDWPSCPITIWSMQNWQDKTVHSSIYTKRIREMQERMNELSMAIDELESQNKTLSAKNERLSRKADRLDLVLEKPNSTNFRQFSTQEIFFALETRRAGQGRSKFIQRFGDCPSPGGSRSRKLLVLADQIIEMEGKG